MRITVPELSLVLLIGPSGSGKSTFAARHFRPSEVLSLESVRQMIADDERDDGAREDAWSALLELAARRLSRGHLTVIDAADLVEAQRREPLLALSAEHHYIPLALMFALPEPTCQIRNGGREDASASPARVSEQHRLMMAAEGGLRGEGFRHVHRFSAPAEIEAATIHRLPLWSNRREDAGPFDIVGPVHGRLSELCALLAQLGYAVEPEIRHPAGRRLVFLGGLIDHGPDSAGVLRLATRAVDSGAAYVLPGHHEARLLRWLRGQTVDESSDGFAATRASFAEAPAELRDAIATFLESSVSHYVLDDGNLVVAHAGLPENLQGRGSAAVRQFALNGESGDAAASEVPAWVTGYQGRARVLYAHPEVDRPLWLNQTLNLNTRGRLTALRYPELELAAAPLE